MIGRFLGKIYLLIWNGLKDDVQILGKIPRLKNKAFAFLARNYVWIMILFGLSAILFALFNWVFEILPQIGKILGILDTATENGKPEDSENIRNLSYAVAVLLGAIAFAATVPFQLIRTYVNERLAKTTEEGHMTDRIAKAIEQLGTDKVVTIDGKPNSKPNLEVRLGAIYSLERIAQDSLRDHVQIMEILCAYVRENSPTTTDNPYPDDANENPEAFNTWKDAIEPIPIDIQSIIDVIGRRNAQQILKEGEYRLDLRNCNLRRVDFRGGVFNRAQFDNSQMDLTKMEEIKLNGAELNGAELNMAELSGAKLSGAMLNSAMLNWAELNMAELNMAELSRAKLNEAGLNWAELNGAELNGAELTGAELNGAMLNKAMLNKADFTAAHTRLAAVKSTDLSGAFNLSEEQVKSMFGDKTTTLPEGFDMPVTWSNEPDLDTWKFYKLWRVAKKDAGLP